MNRYNLNVWRILFSAIGCIFFLSGLDAQIVTTVMTKKDSVLIGDPITLDIKITIPPGKSILGLDFSGYRSIENKIYQSDTVLHDKYADIEVLDFGHWKHQDIGTPISLSSIKIERTGTQQTIYNTITIAIYNAGIFAIPAPMISQNEKTEILASESATVNVFLPENLMKQDTVTLNPIKDIMYEKADISDYLIYLYIFLSILLLAAIGYYFFRHKRKKEAEYIPVIKQPVLPAHEKALLALKSLSERELWQKGLIKEYQSGLTDIIRTYLEDRYDIRALEMTTDEISISLATVDFDKNYINELKEILQIADLVKFAKATPQDDVHSRFMNKAVEFVENTKEAEIIS